MKFLTIIILLLTSNPFIIGQSISTNSISTSSSSTPTSTKKLDNTDLVTTELSIVEKYDGLGLVVDSGKIEIKRGIENLIVGLSIPVTSNVSTINNILLEIDKNIKNIGTIPALKTKRNFAQVSNSLSAIHEDFTIIQKIFFDLSQYIDKQNVVDPKHDCHLEYSLIDEEYVKELQIGVVSFMSRLSFDLTDAQIALDKSKFDNIVTTIMLIKDFIDQSKTELANRITELDSITLGNIPPGLPYILETLACVHSGQIELITLNYCVKCNYGVLCQLELDSVSSLQEYTRFEAINYDGAQIRFENHGQSLLRSSDGHWELLDCNNEIEDQYDELELLDDLLECTTKPVNNPCVNSIFSTEYDTLLTYCNFTYKIEPRVITRTQSGILIMDPLDTQISVKEISGVTHKTKLNIPSKFPVHIISNDDLAVTVGEREIILKPVTISDKRKISYTYLSQQFIKKMQDNALKQDSLDSIEIEHIIGLVFGLLLLTVGTIAITVCCCQIKNSKFYKHIKNRNPKMTSHELRNIARNLAENRNLLKSKRQTKA